jgi:hypothetical protein
MAGGVFSSVSHYTIHEGRRLIRVQDSTGYPQYTDVSAKATE